ncbi:MAG: multidrug DMT transporter permease, partial [Ignavibacteriales bacterium]|nr:multidrug DMT transporter permease [Ignavibacteriales bacterium]
SLVSTHAYVNPVVAVFLGWLLADEPINGRIFIASVVIVSAVVIITTVKARRASQKSEG